MAPGSFSFVSGRAASAGMAKVRRVIFLEDAGLVVYRKSYHFHGTIHLMAADSFLFCFQNAIKKWYWNKRQEM